MHFHTTYVYLWFIVPVGLYYSEFSIKGEVQCEIDLGCMETYGNEEMSTNF